MKNRLVSEGVKLTGDLKGGEKNKTALFVETQA